MTYQDVCRKSHYGHRDWICWEDAGGFHAEPKSPGAVKRALLACGTKKGSWTLVSQGTGMVGFWWLGINLLNQMKRGIY